MSVYRDTEAEVVFEHPHPGPLTAVVYRKDSLLPVYTPLETVPRLANRFTLTLPWEVTQYDGELTVVWTAAGFERRQTIEVVSPIVSLSRLKSVFQNTNLLDGDLRELERNVRLVIEAYTGQRFGYEVGIKRITGTGEKKVALPARLGKLYGITGGPAGHFSVSADGWYLYIHNKNLLYTKEAPPEDFADNKVWTGTGMTGGVIYVPDTYWRQFRVGVQYEIDGEWGYESVPADVQEAAALLASDFAAGENLYRDRYLEAIKAGDWNLTFNQGAYRGTGNARADNLLEKYRRQGMVII